MSAMPGPTYASFRERDTVREGGHAAVIVGHDDFERRYVVLLHMVKELTLNSSQAALRSEAAAAKALLAGKMAAAAARAATLDARSAAGVGEHCAKALEAASEAAAEAAAAAGQARTAVLLAAGHSADPDLMKLSCKASDAAKGAAAAAQEVRQILNRVDQQAVVGL